MNKKIKLPGTFGDVIIPCPVTFGCHICHRMIAFRKKIELQDKIAKRWKVCTVQKVE